MTEPTQHEDLIERLRTSGPADNGVSLADVHGAVTRRRRRTQLIGVGIAAAVTVGVIGGFTLIEPPAPQTTAATRSAPADSTPAPPASVAGVTCPSPEQVDIRAQLNNSGVVPGFDPATQLVPDDAPTAVLACRYERDEASPQTPWLAESGWLRNGAGLVADLRLLGLSNTVMRCPPLEGDTDALLLAYPTGTVVLTAHTRCGGLIRNGELNRSGVLRPYLETALREGGWPGMSPSSGVDLDPCQGTSFARVGTDEQFLPAGMSSVTLCGAGAPVTITPEQADGILTALDRLPLSTNAPGPACVGDDSAPRYQVIAHYPTGPDAQVLVSTVGCGPTVANGNRLTFSDPGAVSAAIQRWQAPQTAWPSPPTSWPTSTP